jgi:hypothetical protein
MKNFRPVHLRKYNVGCSSEDITIDKYRLPMVNENAWSKLQNHTGFLVESGENVLENIQFHIIG